MRVHLLLPALLISTACSSAAPQGSEISSVPSNASPTNVSTYNDPQGSFSLEYPADWSIDQEATLPPLNRASGGVGFVPPADMAKGTDWIDGMVFSEQTAIPCPEFARPQAMQFGGNEFIHGSSSEAAAGNLYLTDMYVMERADLCYSFTLYQHRCNLGPDCGPDHDLPFDESELRSQLAAMLASFRPM